MERYKQIPHTADIAIKVGGRDLRELFTNAAFGMFDCLADLSGLKITTSINISISALSREELLVSWLDELLYNFYTKGIIFSEFDIIDIADTRLKAKASGRLLADNRNRLKKEIKAVTFHNLKIEETAEGFGTEIVFDV